MTSTAHAATVTVTNTNDSGAGSLRQAVTDAAATGDTINFNLTYPATITLTSAEITLDKDLTISGPGAKSLTISGNNARRIFTVSAGKNVTITGLSFKDGMEIGRKIWNLDNCIWTLQGRHRDMLKFAEYIYTKPYGGMSLPFYRMPGIDKKSGKWKYINLVGRCLDRDKVEQWKTNYYLFEGWDPATGHCTRKTLGDLGLGYVADKLGLDV